MRIDRILGGLKLPTTAKGCGSVAFWLALLVVLLFVWVWPSGNGVEPSALAGLPVLQGLLAVLIFCRREVQSLEHCAHAVLWTIGTQYQALLILSVVTLPLLLVVPDIPTGFLGWTICSLLLSPFVLLFSTLGGITAFLLQRFVWAARRWLAVDNATRSI